ncbi:MAG: CNNM domain-containing protein [Bacteroidales bacterium]
MGLLILYLSVALFFSFLCSILEATLLSMTPVYLSIKRKEGKSYASALEKFKKDIDLPLAAILTLNTFAHTIGAAGVGSQVQAIWGKEYLSVASVVLTLIILIFSEIIPKTLGATHWKHLGRFTAISLKIMIYSPLYPFIYLTNFITRLLRRNQDAFPRISQPEFRAITHSVIEDGVIQEEESMILQNLMKFQSILVKNIMTPQVVIEAADENMSISEYYKAIRTFRFQEFRYIRAI